MYQCQLSLLLPNSHVLCYLPTPSLHSLFLSLFSRPTALKSHHIGKTLGVFNNMQMSRTLFLRDCDPDCPVPFPKNLALNSNPNNYYTRSLPLCRFLSQLFQLYHHSWLSTCLTFNNTNLETYILLSLFFPTLIPLFLYLYSNIMKQNTATERKIQIPPTTCKILSGQCHRLVNIVHWWLVS